MGNRNTKSSLRNAIIYLNISADPISASDDKFWNQIFSEEPSLADDIIKNITVQEIRILRDGSPKNFATLAYKMVERLCLATETLCNTQSQQTAVINAVNVLIRMLPCIFEDKTWHNFFSDNYVHSNYELSAHTDLRYPEKSDEERNYVAYLPQRPGSRSATPLEHRVDNEDRMSTTARHTPIAEQLLSTGLDLDDGAISTGGTSGGVAESDIQERSAGKRTLMQALVLSVCDLLFCPEFTVLPHDYGYLSNAVDTPPEDLKSLSTHDYVWEPGVGFESNVNSTTYYDKNRSDLLRTLLVCSSMTLYETAERCTNLRNPWIELFVSEENRHALPIFTSLLNVVFGYKPRRPLLPLNNLLFDASREQLVELSCQLLIAVLDYQVSTDKVIPRGYGKNLFIDYMSRIHRNEDLIFISNGFKRLFNHGFQQQGYLWSSTKSIELDQELQLLFWKTCNLNKKFMQFLLQSDDIQDIVVPILYNLNENFQEPSKTALIHLGVFNLLILSSERNFGVRLNKPYEANVLGNLPEFSGSHVDLMILVFHKLIMYGYKINQLYDYLLTILVNISPYLKGMTLLASKCLIQLFETFSSVMVIFTEPNFHQLVIFLLEIFNNIIQYQFVGNYNLVYTLLMKKDLFINLMNLSTSQKSIDKVLKKLIKIKQQARQIERVASDEKIGASNKEANQIKDVARSSPCDDSDLILATVSSNNQLNADVSTRRQEVSLVATPDLNSVTQPTYPFDKDIDRLNESQQESHHKSTSQGDPKISLDDILNNPNECLLLEDSPELRPSIDSAREQTTDWSVIDEDVDFVRGQTEELSIEVRDQKHSDSIENRRKIVGRGRKWRPTSEWLESWKKTLPLQTVIRMISALDPQIEQMRRSSGRKVDEAEVLKFLQNGTLVGLLPVPHPILIRKYLNNDSSTIWFRTCSWGIIYVRSAIWTGTDIKLIRIL